jgi:hypothetical protein
MPKCTVDGEYPFDVDMELAWQGRFWRKICRLLKPLAERALNGEMENKQFQVISSTDEDEFEAWAMTGRDRKDWPEGAVCIASHDGAYYLAQLTKRF